MIMSGGDPSEGEVSNHKQNGEKHNDHEHEHKNDQDHGHGHDHDEEFNTHEEEHRMLRKK